MRNIILALSYIMALGILTSCGSAEFVPTKDICSLVKHHTDSLYQVQINTQKINSRWYLKEDALNITKLLAAQNKCMP